MPLSIIWFHRLSMTGAEVWHRLYGINHSIIHSTSFLAIFRPYLIHRKHEIRQFSCFTWESNFRLCNVLILPQVDNVSSSLLWVCFPFDKLWIKLDLMSKPINLFQPRSSQNPSRHEHNWQAQRALLAIWPSDKHSGFSWFYTELQVIV